MPCVLVYYDEVMLDVRNLTLTEHQRLPTHYFAMHDRAAQPLLPMIVLVTLRNVQDEELFSTYVI